MFFVQILLVILNGVSSSLIDIAVTNTHAMDCMIYSIHHLKNAFPTNDDLFEDGKYIISYTANSTGITDELYIPSILAGSRDPYEFTYNYESIFDSNIKYFEDVTDYQLYNIKSSLYYYKQLYKQKGLRSNIGKIYNSILQRYELLLKKETTIKLEYVREVSQINFPVSSQVDMLISDKIYTYDKTSSIQKRQTSDDDNILTAFQKNTIKNALATSELASDKIAQQIADAGILTFASLLNTVTKIRGTNVIVKNDGNPGKLFEQAGTFAQGVAVAIPPEDLQKVLAGAGASTGGIGVLLNVASSYALVESSYIEDAPANSLLTKEVVESHLELTAYKILRETGLDDSQAMGIIREKFPVDSANDPISIENRRYVALILNRNTDIVFGLSTLLNIEQNTISSYLEKYDNSIIQAIKKQLKPNGRVINEEDSDKIRYTLNNAFTSPYDVFSISLGDSSHSERIAKLIGDSFTDFDVLESPLTYAVPGAIEQKLTIRILQILGVDSQQINFDNPDLSSLTPEQKEKAKTLINNNDSSNIESKLKTILKLRLALVQGENVGSFGQPGLKEISSEDRTIIDTIVGIIPDSKMEGGYKRILNAISNYKIKPNTRSKIPRIIRKKP
jgi:hypothetical protein